MRLIQSISNYLREVFAEARGGAVYYGERAMVISQIRRSREARRDNPGRQSAGGRNRKVSGSISNSSLKENENFIDLLPEFESRKGFEKRLESGLIIPSKVERRRHYLLKLNEKITVLENGETIGYLCVGTDGVTSNSVDEAKCLYLNLVLNEENLLKKANLHRVPAYSSLRF